MAKSAGKKKDDGRVVVRIPDELKDKFNELRGVSPEQPQGIISGAKAGRDALVLWMAMPEDVQGRLAIKRNVAAKRAYAEEVAARLTQTEAARIVGRAEARAAGRRKTSGRDR